jgi:hypothetical protein
LGDPCQHSQFGVARLDLPMMATAICRLAIHFCCTMTTRALPKAVILVASFVLALLMFVPQQARAHAGHRHEAAVTQPAPEQVKPVAAKPEVPEPTEEQTASSLESVGALCVSTETDQPSWRLTNAPSEDGKSCPAGCCQSMGAHCCPVTLLDATLVIAPPLGLSIFTDLADRGAGIQPGALSEPPKSLI